MAPAREEKSKFATEQLCYYFDSLAKDGSDQGAQQERWEHWLRLRKKIMRLPEASCQTTLHAMEAILDHALSELEGQENQRPEKKDHRKAASQLYEKTRKQLHTDKTSFAP